MQTQASTSVQPGSSTGSIRTVRPLVPFFIPGADIVNETLAPYHTPSPPKSKSKSNRRNNSNNNNDNTSVTLSVRQWDHNEGFFKDAVQVVQDPSPLRQQQQNQEENVQNITKSRLLTPATIRAATEQARRREEQFNSFTNLTTPITDLVATSISPSTEVKTSPSIQSTPKKGRGKQNNYKDRHREHHNNVIINQQSSQQNPGNNNKPKNSKFKVNSHNNNNNNQTQSQLQTTPEAKPRPFAGSTFETASPPPSGLPIPGFIAKMASASSPNPPITVSSNTSEFTEHELAAVELRKMLKI